MGEPAALVLDRVAKSYERKPAVSGVSLEIREGELVTILGPSGSGKTTVLLMIAGFVYPSSGRVLFRGEDVTYMPPHLRNIGMVFQNYALFPHMTVTENVAFPLRMRRVAAPETRDRALAALELVRMEEYGARMPAQLSGGQQQRVALARALVFQPSLLLMDEPLAALDRHLRDRLQLEIKEVQRATGVTIVYVTHDQQEALVLSDRIIVMDAGRVRMEGSPADIYERPADAFVARFVGDTNLLRGTVAIMPGGPVLRLDRQVDIPLGSGAAHHAVGSELMISVRPERVQCPAGPSAAVSLAARVADVTYLGDTVKCSLVLEGTDPPIHLVTRQLVDGASRPRADDRMAIGWRLDDAWILPETQ